MLDDRALWQYSIYVRRAMTDTMPLNWILPLRQIFDHEILFIEQGKIELFTEGAKYVAKENDLVLLPPYIPHTFRAVGEKPLVQPHLHLDFTYREDAREVYIPFEKITDPKKFSLFRENEFAKWDLPYVIKFASPHQSQPILKLIHEIITTNMENSLVSVLKTKILVLNLFTNIIAATYGKNDFPNRNRSLFVSAQLMMEKQLSSTLDLKAIADALGYSKNHLCALYKKQFGITMVRQYEKLKLQKALDYLSQSQLGITEIAETLGFGYVGDFTRFVKRMIGLSPTQYRRSLDLPPQRL